MIRRYIFGNPFETGAVWDEALAIDGFGTDASVAGFDMLGYAGAHYTMYEDDGISTFDAEKVEKKML